MYSSARKAHIIRSLEVLAGLVVLFGIPLFIIKDFVVPSYGYFEIIGVLAAAVCVLISYIVYLLLASKTRVALMVEAATKQLLNTAEQFVSIYDDAPVPYLRLNAKAEIHNPNKAALRFFGVVADELEGKDLFSFLAPDYAPQQSKLAQYYSANIPINREELRMVTKSGEERWVLLSIFAIRDLETGKRAGLASIFDITDEKRLEQAKTEFVSLASHQLRTPLATTKWYTDMLLSGELGNAPEKQKEYLATLARVNKEMVELVDTLLNVSRIEIGTLPIDKKPTDVVALSESIFEELSVQIAQKNLIIKKEYNNLFGQVETDPKLLRIVIQNLVTNAVKYTPEGGTISIVFREVGGERTITVSDNGYGIPAADQPHIFQKLFRAENVKKQSTSQGTGLGLYLVKSIIEALGGKISFTSVENNGSNFTISF